MGNTKIQWTDKSWSPIRAKVRDNAAQIAKDKGYTSLVNIAERMAGHVGPHCERVSHGCDHCYSDSNNGRCLPSNGTGLPFDRRARDLVEPFVDCNILQQPLHWKRPCRVFVENQSDLFGEWLEARMIDEVFAVMTLCPHITFQVLTKRAGQALIYLTEPRTPDGIMEAMRRRWRVSVGAIRWPLPNVWIGVSTEDQKTWDERTAILEQIPAALRFVSLEPQLAFVDVGPTLSRGRISWLIQGGESGTGARSFDVEWARHSRLQCEQTGTRYFLKQLGARCYDGRLEANDPKVSDRKGGNWDEWPLDLRVREFPLLEGAAPTPIIDRLKKFAP